MNGSRESASTSCMEFGTGWDERVMRVFLVDLGWASEESWAKLNHMYMGESLSEPSICCCSLVLSSGWGDRAFLHFPCSLFLSSYHKRGHRIPQDPNLKNCTVQHGKRSFRPQRNETFLETVRQILGPLWTALQHFDLRASSRESLRREVLADPELGAVLHRES